MEQVKEQVAVASVAPIVRIAHTIIEQAIDRNATEIHIEPGPDQMQIYFQVVGEFQQFMRMPAWIYPGLVTRYKVMADVSWASHHQPARGHFTLCHKGRYYDVEVTFPRRLLDPKITMSITPGADAEEDDEDIPI